MAQIVIPELLNEVQTAELLGVKPSTFAVWRATRRYPLPYVRVGHLIRYRRQDVAQFIEARRVKLGEPHPGRRATEHRRPPMRVK